MKNLRATYSYMECCVLHEQCTIDVMTYIKMSFVAISCTCVDLRLPDAVYL